MYPIIQLKKNKQDIISRKHPWIFSGALFNPPRDLADGSIVYVQKPDGEICATGHFFNGSIAIRILSFDQSDPNQEEFWADKINSALELRKLSDLILNDTTNAFRLVHGEGDLMPGLIIDIYNDCAVMESHSAGISNAKDLIATVLQNIEGLKLKSIYFNSKEKKDGVEPTWLLGNEESTEILENGLKFKIDWVNGQKTGFFLDQRDNRELVRKYASGRKVLNIFGYTGGFAAYAMAGGAKSALNIDISEPACKMADENFALNDLDDKAKSISMDGFEAIKEYTGQSDLVILDPPAFAKNIKARHKAVIGYKRLNEMTIRRIPPGGILFTFSCSQVVDRKLFYDTVTAAGIEAGRQLQIIHYLSQGADHPINLFHPEGSYLKGLALRVL